MPTYVDCPIVWDFYKTIGPVDALGGIIEYYDTEAQTLFLKNGVRTHTMTVTNGDWQTANENITQIQVNEDAYTDSNWDHPSNGILYGVTTDGTNLIFLRYVYAMDISNLCDSWNWTSQSDSPINQFSATMQNIGTDVFTTDITLFQPGSRIRIGIRLGDSELFMIGTGWLDECSYDITADTCDLSGRNTIGYFLKDQTFDEHGNWPSGSSNADNIIKAIFEYASVGKYNVGEGYYAVPFSFDASKSIMDGIEEILSAYTTTELISKIVELADGTICVGYEAFLNNLLPNSYYSFDEGHDVFARKTSKMVDGTYTSLRATGKDSNDADLTPVTVAINNFQFWRLGVHKTIHVEAPQGFDQAGLQEWAEAQAVSYQYVGISEDFTGPFRPQLIVGDVAEVVAEGTGTTLGVITEVRQTFSRKNGFRTEFSVDSGGLVTDGSNYEIYTRSAAINGFNRRQRIMDIVRYVAGKK